MSQAPPSDQDVSHVLTDRILAEFLRERDTERRWKMIRRGLWVTASVILFVSYLFFNASLFGWRPVPGESLVGVVRIDGEIASGNLASADEVIPALTRAFERSNVTSVALAIDSPGGAPVEAERIYRTIEALRLKYPDKPINAFIHNIGASAAYLIALHCDKIYAADYSLVGSVGAVISGWDFHRVMNKLEIGQRVYASGELKTMLNPFAPTTPAAERAARALVADMGSRFKAEVARYRGKKLARDVDYATGEVWTGPAAREIGLVDEIGTLDAVAQTVFKARAFDFGPRKSFPMIGAQMAEFGLAVGQGIAQAAMLRAQ